MVHFLKKDVNYHSILVALLQERILVVFKYKKL